jgi:hypothetical protein
MRELEEIGVSERQARDVLRKILENSPGITLKEILSPKVRIVATRGPTFLPLGSVTLPNGKEVRLSLVSNEELLGPGKSGHGSTSIATALEHGWRPPTEEELSLLQNGWIGLTDIHLQVDDSAYEVDVGMTLAYRGDMEDQNLHAWHGPKHQWILAQV